MKVLLINPPVPNILRESLPPVVEDETGVFPPLGLLYVAAYAEEIENCSVQVLDCQADKIDHESLTGIIRKISPDVVGIQVMTFTVIDAIIVAKTVRKEAPEAFIVCGGPHPTIFPQETVSLPEVDAVISGEGEYTFSSLIRALQEHKAPESVPEVLTKKEPHFRRPIEHIQDLDKLKLPSRHLIDSSKYNSPLARSNPLTTIMSSRGCPARCIFCDRPQMGKKFRKRSAAKVVEEMRYCKEKLGIREFLFYDDTFTIDKQRALDVCDILLDSGLDVSWDIRTRVDTVTPEIIHKLRQAGCHRIHYGVETGSPLIQKRLRKNLNLEKVNEVFSLTKKEGIEVLGYFMLGCPDETEEEMKKSFDLIRALPMDYVHIGVFTPYPGTEIYAEALSAGFYNNDYWKEFALNPTTDFVPKYWNQYFSDEELLGLMKKAYGQFYGRPSYIFKRLLKLRSMNELFRKGILGFKLLKTVYFDKSHSESTTNNHKRN